MGCMFVKFLCVHALIRVSTNIFLSKFSSWPPPPPPFEKSLDPRLTHLIKLFWDDVWMLETKSFECNSSPSFPFQLNSLEMKTKWRSGWDVICYYTFLNYGMIDYTFFNWTTKLYIVKNSGYIWFSCYPLVYVASNLITTLHNDMFISKLDRLNQKNSEQKTKKTLSFSFYFHHN